MFPSDIDFTASSVAPTKTIDSVRLFANISQVMVLLEILDCSGNELILLSSPTSSPYVRSEYVAYWNFDTCHY